MKLHVYSGAEARKLRKELGLVQADFWEPFGAIQSTGSRYESDREIPESVQILLNIAFGSETKASTIVTALRTLGRAPEKKTKPTVPRRFGRMP